MILATKRTVPPDHPVFEALPVRHLTIGPARERVAVHVSGRHADGRPAVVCVPGYHRNMSDFTDFAALSQRALGDEWRIVLVDLKGRGRSSDRADRSGYISTRDAEDLEQVCAALCIERAVFVGQGYGGQVLMTLAVRQPTLLAGTVLIDAGPVSDPRGLVRLRNNLRDLDGPRSAAGFRAMFRRMLTADYAGLPETRVDELAGRTHYLDRRDRVRSLFDPQLLRLLDAFEHDDVLVAQWQLFGALQAAPLMMMRTQQTDQLRREVFEEMMRRRPDADGYVIEGQASPALLNVAEDVAPIVDFVRRAASGHTSPPAETASAEAGVPDAAAPSPGSAPAQSI